MHETCPTCEAWVPEKIEINDTKVKNIFPWPLVFIAVIFLTLVAFLAFANFNESKATGILHDYKGCDLVASEPATYDSHGESRWIYRCEDVQGYSWVVDVLVSR